MALWISLIVGFVAAVFAGGWRSLQFARRDDFEQANRWLRRGAMAMACTAMVCVAVLLKWPFVSRTVPVPVEISRTVMETVQVPVQVTRWFFWSATEMQSQQVQREITETVMRPTTELRFSFVMLIALGLVGVAAYHLQLRVVRLAWWWFG